MSRFPFPLSRLALPMLALAFVLTACDAGLESDAAVSEVEAAEAAEIVASALADTDGGLMASLSDLTASVSPEGFGEPGVVATGRDRQRDGDGRRHRACRPSARTLDYDDASGTHTIAYACSVETPRLAKSIAAELDYRFRDAEDGFLPRPWTDWSAVGSVRFEGTKSGSLERTRGDVSVASSFEQTGAWALSNLAGDGAAQLAGSQTREGVRTRTRGDSTATRAFSVELSSDDIQIRDSDDGLTRAVTGTLSYSAVIEIDSPRRTETKTVEGTITLDGSGRALLRVFGLRNVYRVSLFDGSQDAA